MKRINRILAVTSFLILIFNLTVTSAQDLVILHTNDTHSNIESLVSGRNKGYGGVQRRANYIDSVRKMHPDVLLLDAGDYNQGTPYYTLFRGEVEVKLNNAMGYDVISLGNHEFDNGVQELAERLKKAEYTTVCANYNFKNTPLEGLVKPYTIINKGGKKIGILGLLLDLDGYVNRKNRENLIFRKPVETANKIARILRQREKCDLVIALTHIGFDADNERQLSDQTLAKYSKNIDIIIGGHSHTFLEKPVVIKNRHGKGVIVNQAGTAGVFVGRLDINF
ncbi:MAG: metallophosphatase [Bacteroidales bacterium]|nr:metallophosphatase [Bacteroidales bacterium]MDD2424844.1 metallophosphatase [Bacteroidales bacterium]MDD3989972.1 metallophosphatase [Bacteroidales bacterium]MDD4639015.1 metallophosphatase [Bacteroidales bacterium]